MRSLTEDLDQSSSSTENHSSGRGLRDRFNDAVSGLAGKIILAIIALGMVWFLFTRFQSATGPAEGTIMDARTRMMDPLTGEMLWYKVEIGKRAPDGYYPVEYCWSDDHPDALAVPVVLNNQLFAYDDPRHNEPTICPCGDQVVVPRNPRPEAFLGLTPEDYQTGQAPGCAVEHYRALLGN